MISVASLRGLAQSLSPNVTVVLLTLGLLLLFVECLRPGRVLPGATGLLMLLLSIHRLASLPLRPAALTLAVAAGLLFAVSLIRPFRWIAGALGTLCLAVALPLLVDARSAAPYAGVTPQLGAVAGLLLGIGSALLLQIAARARANKRTSVTTAPRRPAGMTTRE